MVFSIIGSSLLFSYSLFFNSYSRLKLSLICSLTSWADLIPDMDISICKNLFVYSLIPGFLGDGKRFFNPATFLFRPSWLS